MMTSESKFRLGEYIIVEHGGVLLTWISHIAIGSQLSGRCFIIGNILVIGPWEHEEAGYLKLEFHEQLMRLPAWTKTPYYCLSTDIRKIDVKQSLRSCLIKHSFIPKIGVVCDEIKGPGAFQLGRYKITVDANGIISWQTIGESNKTIGGKCVTESGILFIGPKEITSDAEQNRKVFLPN